MPLLLVRNQPIWSNAFMHRLDDYQLVYGITEKNNAILERMVYETKLKILARQKQAQLEVWQKFADPPTAETGAQAVLTRAAEAAGWENAFRFWFYSQRTLNRKSYETADKILAELKMGADFYTLAKIYSQDTNSRNLGGDTGPTEIRRVIYELRTPLLNGKTGQTLILPSRYGVHVIQPYLKKTLPDGNDVLYLKHILLGTGNFEEWVKNETQDYKITYLIRIQ